MEQVQEKSSRATAKAPKKLVPELRFPEFNGEWKVSRLEEKVKKFQAGQFLPAENIEVNGVYPVYGGNGIRGFFNDYNHQEEACLIGRQGALCGNVQFVKDKLWATEHAIIAAGNDSTDAHWLYYLLYSANLNKWSESSAQPGLSALKLKRLKFTFPGREEQEKIAGFLGVVDARFGLLKRKKELLEAYKKGVMQKLFSREIRFKDEEGREYPEWEEKRGNEVFSSISDKNHSSELPILAITQEKGAIPRESIDYDISVTPASISTYKVVREGDFIISLRSFQGGIEYSRYHGICSPAYIILRPHVPICDGFFSAFLKTPTYISQMTSKLEGIRDGKMVSYKYFSETKLPFPSLSEQEAIAGFISLVSARVDEISLQISESERFKKGLLQKMFV